MTANITTGAASTHPSVALFFGSDVDDSATPPTYERNRFVADLVYHYACIPFLDTNHEQGDAGLLSETSVTLGTSAPWLPPQPVRSSVFAWHSERLPPVGPEELCEYHDAQYVRYLSVRETLSDMDERALETKRRKAEEGQPVLSRRRSSVTRTDVDGLALGEEEPPLRMMPDLIPVEADAEYGLVGDASPFLGMWRTIQATTSGTLAAVRWLLSQEMLSSKNVGGADGSEAMPSSLSPRRFGAAIHWFGGRHHAKRDFGSGFCYVNDVVLGAIALRRGLTQVGTTDTHSVSSVNSLSSRGKVLIVDLDAHHGDGTQEAFYYDAGCFTLSVHGHGTGIFPGSGTKSEAGNGPGKGCCINVPLPPGATDGVMVPLARHFIREALCAISGEAGDFADGKTVRDTDLGAIVLVCGADGLQGDPLGNLNYTIGGLQCVIRLLIEAAVCQKCKLLVLGSGGYVNTSAARLAAAVTRDVLSAAAVVAKCESEGLSPPLPDADGSPLFVHSPLLLPESGVPVSDSSYYFTRYGPSFLMHGLPPAVVPRVNMLSEGAPFYNTHKALLGAAMAAATADTAVTSS